MKPKTEYHSNRKRHVWLDVSLSETTGAWVVIPMHQPSSSKTRREFMQIKGSEIIYCVRGFAQHWQAEGFMRTYHKAKRDGFVRRYRLD